MFTFTCGRRSSGDSFNDILILLSGFIVEELSVLGCLG